MIISHRRTIIIKTLVISITLVAAGIGGWTYLQPTSRAADLKNFNPGNIISDTVMSNKNSMTVQQIQAFLESKNSCNNTNTYMASWYPNLQYNIKDGKFVCMAKESFDGQSAAQIIWQVSQDYNINPQVLIVLLEKEQGLVTDTWPNHIQYRSATGYGCPDTAACDSQYFGLKNQLQNAAALFRQVLNGGWSNYPVGQTYVQYNPNVACGGSVINIQNRATSALYRYTPHQPNQSALNAGYGTGDSCGAYGNRNFWLFFTDWFGSTQGIEIRGSIKIKYDLVNGSSLLGVPLQSEQGDASFWWQRFEKGYIVGNSKIGYYISKGSIREKWAQYSYQNGQLGLPTADETYDSVNKLYSQKYEGGEIKTHSSGVHKSAIKGSIYRTYQLFDNKFNIPLNDEEGDGSGLWWQKFTDGYIIGSAKTGYYESFGSIRNKWAESGYQSGPVGVPTSNIIETSSGCYSQTYTNGTIKGCLGKYEIVLDSPVE